jgi:hypothetical protein
LSNVVIPPEVLTQDSSLIEAQALSNSPVLRSISQSMNFVARCPNGGNNDDANKSERCHDDTGKNGARPRLSFSRIHYQIRLSREATIQSVHSHRIASYDRSTVVHSILMPHTLIG